MTECRHKKRLWPGKAKGVYLLICRLLSGSSIVEREIFRLVARLGVFEHHTVRIKSIAGDHGQAVVAVEEEEWLRIINENFRPYQEPVTDITTDELGEITQDYGATQTSTQTIGAILAGAQ